MAGELTISLGKVLQNLSEFAVLGHQPASLLVSYMEEPHQKTADGVHLMIQVVQHCLQLPNS